ncbi:MAG: cell division protein ZapE [Gordonia sp. (in: high G+C Gram-positive bacteria)]|uniref:cell division protein ZapE n=1 Tax=Gordonia sp. (in: high G+C Gram-positive bacteria) TaxID=84139 RepID=UPI0039E4D928
MDFGDLVRVAQTRGVELDPPQRAACAALAGSSNIYLAGPAGRGKTLLLDSYVQCLPKKSVVRVHWHEFLCDLHLQIRDRGGLGGAIDGVLGSARVLCFDELQVDDPADGIFLDTLIRELVGRGVRLVVTSNCLPSELMPNPLFHDTFQPTIDLIERICEVVPLDAGVDYRSRVPHTGGFASGRWAVCPPSSGRTPTECRVGSRWFWAWDVEDEHLGVSFTEICGRPLSAADYLDLATRYGVWTVSDVPDLVRTDREAAQRFVHLIDVLYDRDVVLRVESEVDRTEFATSGRLPAGTTRMRSRLSTLA